MKTLPQLDSDPYALMTTKRQIFSSVNASQLQSINKQNSQSELDDIHSIKEYQNILFHKAEKQISLKCFLHAVLPYKRQRLLLQKGERKLLCKKEPVSTSSQICTGQKGINSLIESLNQTWKKGGLKIIKYVARFMHQLKTKADKLKIKLMNSYIFSMLGDKSSDFSEFQLGDYNKLQKGLICQMLNKSLSVISSLWNYVSVYLNRIGIIYPESTFKIFWDSVVVCFIVINIFYIPMSLSFELDKSSQITSLFFETIPSYIFITEIVFNFNTAFYSHGIIHINRSEIFFHYLKNNFLWDLLVAIPFILAQFQIPYIQFILLIRITRVRSMIQNVEDLLNAKEEVQAVLELGKLVYFLVLVAHMCSCGWHLLGRIEYENYSDERSWLVFYGYYQQDWQDKYIVSLYWSVITTLTVGYGDIVPQTSIERVFVVIVALVICGVFGYTISTIGEILKNLEERKAALKKSMKKVNQYIKQKQLNLQLSLKVRKYFEFKHQIDEQLQEQDDSVLNKLSEQLKSEVLIDIYKRVLMKSKFLNDNIPDNLINNLCQKVKQATYAPGYDIVNVYDPASKLIFILDGKINSYFISKSLDVIIKSDKEATVGKFQKQHQQGDVIGEQEFIINSAYQFHFKAQTFSSVAYIERHDFLQILGEDEQCRQQFHQLKEKLTYQKTYGRTCDICKWTHRYQDCPFVFHQTNIYKIARQSNIPVQQSRLVFDRSRYSKQPKFVFDHQNIVMEGLEYIINNGIMSEDLLNDKYLAKLGYGVQDFPTEKSMMSEDSNSNESNFVDNLSSAPKKKSAQFEKMRTSFLGHNRLKQGVTFSKKLQTEDEEKQTPIGIYSQLANNGVSIQQSVNSINQCSSGTNANLKASIANVHSQKKDSGIQQKQFSILAQQNNTITNYPEEAEQETRTLQKTQGNIIISEIDIDKLKEYQHYYPEFNVNTIISQVNRFRQSVFSQTKKRNLKDKLRSIRLNRPLNRSLNQSSRNLDEEA